MIEWFLNLFRKSKSDDQILLVEEPKKNKFTTTVLSDGVFYNHDLPEIPLEKNDMSVVQEDSQPQAVVLGEHGGMEQVPVGLDSFWKPHPQVPMQQPPPTQHVQQPQQLRQPRRVQQPHQQPPQQQAGYPNQPVYQQPQQQSGQQQPVQQQPRKPQYPSFEKFVFNGEYHLYIDLPAMKPESEDIAYKDGVLVVSAARETSLDKMIATKRKGFSYSKEDPSNELIQYIPPHIVNKYSFSFNFNRPIDETAIGVEYVDGILHVVLPLRAKGEAVALKIKR